MRKIILSVAPISADDTNINPNDIIKDVVKCAEVGASIVHLHVRNQKGELTADIKFLKEIVTKIKLESDVIIQVSTGGVSSLTIEERCVVVPEKWVEATSLNVGSVNLGKAVYTNPIEEVCYCIEKILKNKKIPEVEVFELGMIQTIKNLSLEYPFVKPLLLNIVLGHVGAAPDTLWALGAMVNAVNELFPERNEMLWGITHANRKNFDLINKALDLGASTVRIGFEDSKFLNENAIARDNTAIVELTVDSIIKKGFLLATPLEARKMLHISRSEEVH